MKLSNFLFLILLGASITLLACNSKGEKPVATEEVTTSPDGFVSPEGSVVPQPDQTRTDPSAANTEPHYKCPKNCEGGVGGGPGKCPVCATDLVHNAAFHQAGAEPGAKTMDPVLTPSGSKPSGSTPSGATNVTTAQAPQPTEAQNAKGDWHFTCTKGCTGGSGAAGTCAKCGAPLAHNATYHQ